MIFLKVIPGALLFFLSGHIVLKFADRRAEAAFGPVSYAGASFMLGLGAISLQMFFYSLLSIPFSSFLISAPWIALGAAMLFLPAFKRTAFRTDGQKMGWQGYLLFTIILSQVLYSFAYALTMPLSGWDAWFIWFMKARAFYMDGSVSAAFLIDPAYVQDHPEYPLLVPLAISWIYTAIGATHEEAGKIIYPLQFAALLSIFHYGVRKVSGSRTAGLLFTALLSLTPLLLLHGAGFPVQVDPSFRVKDFTGYADLALSAYFLAAGLFIFLYAREGRASFAFLASVALAMGAWTKNEGLTFALLGFMALAATALIREKRDFRTLALALVPLALFILPWSVYKAAHGLGSEYVENMGPAVFFSNLKRLGQIVPYMAGFMFLKPGVTGLVWWAWVITAILGLRTALSARTVLLQGLILGQLAIYVFVYVITPVDLKWHLGTSLDRLVLHMVPLAMFAAAVTLTRISGLKGNGERR
ncbi:hypothetical protein BAC1_01025 [uncultured bacterium]|nr:hypothetical protein BAC1_01025 [uncultured bacterium]